MFRLLIGLGNPDTREFSQTRPNAGRRAARLVSPNLVARRSLRVILPETYMNLSAAALPMGAKAEEVLVLVDDFRLPVGRVRIRTEGGAGGHNGLASLIERLGEKFARIRIGVGPSDGSEVPPAMWSDYVLSAPGGEEAKRLREGEALAAEAVGVTLEAGIETAMGRFNG